MSFDIILMSNTSDDNVLDKQLAPLATFTGDLKRETSIIEPIINIEGNIPLTCNYLHIPEFNRYYFVNDIRSINARVFEISAKVDVLTTYKNEIRGCEGIIARQQLLWNLYVDDGSFKLYQNPRLKIKKFPTGFSTEQFVLAVAGS